MDIHDLRQEVGKVKWFHTIDLGAGIITPGMDDTPSKLKRLHLPENLAGTSVLDIGAFDGFFSFEAERRGASRVVAADNPAWTTWPTKKAGFDLAKRVFKSNVEEIQIDVMDLSPAKIGVSIRCCCWACSTTSDIRF
jgi:tRNA (mo5U34)-methyltransferase